MSTTYIYKSQITNHQKMVSLHFFCANFTFFIYLTHLCHNNMVLYSCANPKGETMTKTRKTIIFALVLLFGLMLSACGSDDGSSDATGNHWDKMSWDQGKWG